MRIGQPAIQFIMAEGQTEVVDFEQMKDCGVDIVPVGGILGGSEGTVITLAMGDTATGFLNNHPGIKAKYPGIVMANISPTTVVGIVGNGVAELGKSDYSGHCHPGEVLSSWRKRRTERWPGH